ncbi:NlpC/P60 family protein [Suttonella ornithocola]|uniref:Dipeptidyl-peptidase 6 n=1 Tax=Suttonella ornithocola TaxID=279832 RepID=A0A380MM24_9GAMM|nr:NlpC/P60 family protein [Suttonella ornithocola]SUO93675.1 Dipeptidyl-peptidase 6 [Suttonella ornithocola]
MFEFDEVTAHDSRIYTDLPVGAYALMLATDAWLFQAPDATSARLTQFLYGEPLKVYEQSEQFYFVQSQRDNYCGWIHGSFLKQVEALPEQAKWRTCAVASVTREPDMKSPLLSYLAADSLLYLDAQSESGEYLHIVDKGWIHRRHVVPMDARFDIVAIAREQLYRSYVWGGRAMAGLDCSALAQLCYRFAGHELPRDSDLQRIYMDLHHQKVRAAELIAGDLIFVPGHVMIASGNQTIIHANGYHMRVVEEPLQAAVTRMKAELGEKFGISAYRWSS